MGRPVRDSPDAIMEEINASIGFDRKLAAQDIAGSLAHVAMLGETGISVEGGWRQAIGGGLGRSGAKSRAAISRIRASSKTSI